MHKVVWLLFAAAIYSAEANQQGPWRPVRGPAGSPKRAPDPRDANTRAELKINPHSIIPVSVQRPFRPSGGVIKSLNVPPRGKTAGGPFRYTDIFGSSAIQPQSSDVVLTNRHPSNPQRHNHHHQRQNAVQKPPGRFLPIPYKPTQLQHHHQQQVIIPIIQNQQQNIPQQTIVQPNVQNFQTNTQPLVPVVNTIINHVPPTNLPQPVLEQQNAQIQVHPVTSQPIVTEEPVPEYNPFDVPEPFYSERFQFLFNPQVRNIESDSFSPYTNVQLNLDGYENDPYYDAIKQMVSSNGIRLRKKERPPEKLHEVNENNEELSDEEIKQRLVKQEDQENFTPQYEPHTPEKKPHYYVPPVNKPVDYDEIEKKIPYPRANVERAKVHPRDYIPLKNHIKQLKNEQAERFSEGGNEYPEVKSADDEEEQGVPEGNDIYDRQKTEFDARKAAFDFDFDDFRKKHFSHPTTRELIPQRRPDNRDENQQPEEQTYNEPQPRHQETNEEGDREENDREDGSDEERDDEAENSEQDFIPVKMYAQVRHSETVKHMPREAAQEEAVTYDEVVNAPRLREAIKESKAQTVYSEEGYEDNAYDHLGHHKHASNHEGHGGHVTHKGSGGGVQKSHGSEQYADDGRSSHGGDRVSKKHWKDEVDKNEQYDDREGYNERGRGYSVKNGDQDGAGTEEKKVKKVTLSSPQAKKFKGKVNKLVMSANVEQTMVQDANGDVTVKTKSRQVTMNSDPNSITEKPRYVRLRPNYYWKRKKSSAPSDFADKNGVAAAENDPKKSIRFPVGLKRNKRQSAFSLPHVNFDEAFLPPGGEIVKTPRGKNDNSKRVLRDDDKYPYYQSKSDLMKDSPLRYAENLNNVPRKTAGGSEFYDSRSGTVCEEIVADVDPVPDRIKNKTPESESTRDEEEDEDRDDEGRSRRHALHGEVLLRRRRDFEQNHRGPRLRGLGDKIDCFKAKYFDENPLDNPLFSEDVIEPPEPIGVNSFFKPSPFFKLKSESSPREEKKADSPQLKASSNNLNKKSVAFKPTIDGERKQIHSASELKPKKAQPLHHKRKIEEKHQPNLSDTRFPSTIFDKYISSLDPEMNVYGDVIRIIRASMRSDDDLDRVSHPKTIMHFPNHRETVHPRVIRENHFVYEPYKIIHQQTTAKTPITSARPGTVKKPKRINLVGHDSVKSENIRFIVKRSVDDRVHEGPRVANATLDLTDAESVANNETELIAQESFDSRRGEPKYENGEEVYHKNHKKYYSPVTVKSSVTPEELNAEYQLKAKEESVHTLKQIEKLDEQEAEGVLIDDIANKVTAPTNSTDESQEAIRNEARLKSINPILAKQTVFDVSAYIPKVTTNNALPRHILSSKYNQKKSTAEDEEDVESVENEDSNDSVEVTTSSTRRERPRQRPPKEVIRHTIERLPGYASPEKNAIQTEEVKPVAPEKPEEVRVERTYTVDEDVKPTETTGQSAQPKNTRSRRRRIKVTTISSSTPNVSVIDYKEEPFTEQGYNSRMSAINTPQVTHDDYSASMFADSADDILKPTDDSKYRNDKDEITHTKDAQDEIEQWKTVFEEPSDIEEEIKPTSYRRSSRRKTAPKKKYEDPESDEDEEEVKKPKILEKTSTKRKTTVTTDSGRYENDDTEAKPEVRKIRKGKNRRRKPIRIKKVSPPKKQEDDDDDDEEELEIKETRRVVSPKKKTYDSENIETRSAVTAKKKVPAVASKSASIKKKPEVKSRDDEEDEDEDDDEDEEVVEKETPAKPYKFHHDPDLATKVNRLSEVKKDDQHPVHSDVEIFSADLDINKGPKHGGNYKKYPGGKKTKKTQKTSELEDLNVDSEAGQVQMHGGNYRKARQDSPAVEDRGISARVLNSFVSLVPITPTATPKPLFEKNPGKRLYYFLSE